MKSELYEKLFLSDVSPRRRAVQVANRLIRPVLGPRLGLLYVVEYPKCGATWLRKMLQSYTGAPDLNLSTQLIRPRGVIQTHELHRAHMRPAVLLVRDPRDVYVSFYHYEIHFEGQAARTSIAQWYAHDPEAPVREDFLRYLEAKLLKPTHPWFFYSELVADWRHRPGVHLTRYEDLLADPAGALTQAVRALGLPVDMARVERAVADNTFAAATRREYGEARTAGQTDNRRFIRKGVAGDWKNHFNRAAAELLQRVDGGLLRSLGYEADGGWIDAHFGAADQASPKSAG